MTTSNTPLPTNSHLISLADAVLMTSTYRTNREQVLAVAYQGQDILAISETFNRAAIDQLMATPGCAGLRIYYGMDTSFKVHAVMVAVNNLNEDILPAAVTTQPGLTADDVIIVEEGQRCPPICPKSSALNP